MVNFWQNLNKPFSVLAPMDDVTDNVFRKVILNTARPDVFFTEFTNADGLTSPGSKIVGRKLKYEKDQHPIVAQIWGNDPENIIKAAKIVKDLGFDGVDFNMSCPVRNIVKRGCGAKLIGNNSLAKEIIASLKEGAKGIPISVKTRLGLSKNIIEEWATFLLSQKLDALTVHARTASQMSKFPADWEQIGLVVKIKNKISPNTIIIGNGDVKSIAQGKSLADKYGVDGIMIARGVFDNPWVFDPDDKNHTKEEYLNLLLKHFDYYESENPDPVVFARRYPSLKKFFKMYIKDFDGANILRQSLMETKNLEEARHLLYNELHRGNQNA
jgi:tRNA-dihydrouridine synthase